MVQTLNFVDPDNLRINSLVLRFLASPRAEVALLLSLVLLLLHQFALQICGILLLLLLIVLQSEDALGS
jgi:hypothetical protein